MDLEELPTVPTWSVDDWRMVFDTSFPESARDRASETNWHLADPGAPPASPFGPERISRFVGFWEEGRIDYADASCAALVVLDDGQYASITAWSDSSGWGCRDGATVTVGPYDEVVLFGLDDDAREKLGLATSSNA